ncbi:hypothetical protein QAD02_012184 [Eretmocerus hayati]|uniref:Uncharacterized protein n=1 Tax=Eretmocerus hayati TaxID=131215 RepID=A0ACC2NZ43_9HYME|nr:hypothetical protein QAD02_012184 [Eretmocerus hayati]
MHSLVNWQGYGGTSIINEERLRPNAAVGEVTQALYTDQGVYEAEVMAKGLKIGLPRSTLLDSGAGQFRFKSTHKIVHSNSDSDDNGDEAQRDSSVKQKESVSHKTNNPRSFDQDDCNIQGLEEDGTSDEAEVRRQEEERGQRELAQLPRREELTEERGSFLQMNGERVDKERDRLAEQEREQKAEKERQERAERARGARAERERRAEREHTNARIMAEGDKSVLGVLSKFVAQLCLRAGQQQNRGSRDIDGQKNMKDKAPVPIREYE